MSLNSGIFPKHLQMIHCCCLLQGPRQDPICCFLLAWSTWLLRQLMDWSRTEFYRRKYPRRNILVGITVLSLYRPFRHALFCIRLHWNIFLSTSFVDKSSYGKWLLRYSTLQFSSQSLWSINLKIASLLCDSTLNSYKRVISLLPCLLWWSEREKKVSKRNAGEHMFRSITDWPICSHWQPTSGYTRAPPLDVEASIWLPCILSAAFSSSPGNCGVVTVFSC